MNILSIEAVSFGLGGAIMFVKVSIFGREDNSTTTLKDKLDFSDQIPSLKNISNISNSNSALRIVCPNS